MGGVGLLLLFSSFSLLSPISSAPPPPKLSRSGGTSCPERYSYSVSVLFLGTGTSGASLGGYAEGKNSKLIIP